jgi:ankyrin repeat protein
MLDNGWTALHYASKEGDKEIIKLLLETYNCDPSVTSTTTL